jgi:hypothetical protein
VRRKRKMDLQSSNQALSVPIEIKEDSQRFFDLCDGLKAMHSRKAADYGNGKDPLGNFEQARDWGITPFLGVMVRIGDKIARLQSFVKKGALKNESVHDTLRDLAAYALLADIIITREELGGPKQD